LNVLEAVAVDLDNLISDGAAERVKGDVVGIAGSAAHELRVDVGGLG